VDDTNLFTSLSAYRPGGNASPFENYCTSGLAYLLQVGNEPLAALFAAAAGCPRERISAVAVQPRAGGSTVADMIVTFAGGAEALVEVEVEGGASRERLRAQRDNAGSALILVGLDPLEPEEGSAALGWLEIAGALTGDSDRVAHEFGEFVRRDVLGLESVDLDDAVRTNRLYALGGAALRERFGGSVRYENSSSPPVEGRYRYLGTTFAPNGSDLHYWIGIVNEGLPLSEHYHLMLASKSEPLVEPAGQPRVTGNWKWDQWTGLGRVVRPVGRRDYADLLGRIQAADQG